MSLQARIDSLKDSHQALEAALSEESHRPRPNLEAVVRLKHQKLQLKDEMERLSKRSD